MSLLSFVYRNGLWLSWPLLGLGFFLLWFFIVSVVRLNDRNFICSLPLVETQIVDFAEAGRVDLWLEGPQLTPRFGGLSFALKGGDDTPLTGSMTLFRRRSSGLSKVRIIDRKFTLPHPGGYLLQVKGLGQPRADDADHRLIFMRPFLPETIGCIVGIVLGALLGIGSIVNFFLRLSQGSGA